ncbi:hypothetical protein AAL_00010 [Moelleriella libera RCEF 2490]|uniref:Uncharacterized protein n=1 Tax=Moelleriella libera RCEF 2490 TaxID=1081109 RepID=A0A166RLD8_9HYPO|nr:hypothetical protein AAL_00010 [Moelleriella libera RCEF 2490]
MARSGLFDMPLGQGSIEVAVGGPRVIEFTSLTPGDAAKHVLRLQNAELGFRVNGFISMTQIKLWSRQDLNSESSLVGTGNAPLPNGQSAYKAKIHIPGRNELVPDGPKTTGPASLEVVISSRRRRHDHRARSPDATIPIPAIGGFPFGQFLYLEVQWTRIAPGNGVGSDSAQGGTSTSGLFTIVDRDGSEERFVQIFNTGMTDEQKVGADRSSSPATTATAAAIATLGGGGGSSRALSTAAATDTAYPSAGTTASAPITSSASSASSASTSTASSDGNGALSAGAIAGIVVGSVLAALIVLAACVWFGLARRRRRRRQPRRHHPIGSTGRSSSEAKQGLREAAVEEKEADLAPAPALATPPVSTATTTAAPAAAADEVPANAPSRTKYAEQGMTDEERRRWEDEERRLDDEIARARGGA